ncbi:MAG: hypothetical protein U0744_05725 [Gemmataceae bacterium]
MRVNFFGTIFATWHAIPHIKKTRLARRHQQFSPANAASRPTLLYGAQQISR